MAWLDISGTRESAPKAKTRSCMLTLYLRQCNCRKPAGISRPGMKKLLETPSPATPSLSDGSIDLDGHISMLSNTVKLFRERDNKVTSISDGTTLFNRFAEGLKGWRQQGRESAPGSRALGPGRSRRMMRGRAPRARGLFHRTASIL
jgi:hypothetical protein